MVTASILWGKCFQISGKTNSKILHKKIVLVSESKTLIKVGFGRMSGELMVLEEGRGRGRLQHMATIDLGSLR